MIRQIRRDQVELGMFIQGFRGSWLSHPFRRSHFILADPADLAKLRASDVAGVLIDEGRGAPLAPPARGAAAAPAAARPEPHSRQSPPPDRQALDRAEAERVVARSGRVMRQVFDGVRQVFDGVRLGRAIRSDEVLAVVADVSASVERNRSALTGILRLKSKHEYTYLHSVAVCALMVNLAREIGMPEPEVRDAGLAGLRHDIGKMEIPDALLDKAGPLSAEEFALVREHPVRGHRLLAQSGEVSAGALDVCLHHHERADGKGYPAGLCGAALSRLARMGAICDVYDALTSNRAYKASWTPAEAVTAMRAWEGQFDPELLFKFFRSIGVLPAGMLVRLRSNRLGLVLDNGRRATRPRVRAFLATVDRAFAPIEDVVIDDGAAGDALVSEERPDCWSLHDWPALSDRILHARPGATLRDARARRDAA